tara:strand:- start:1193 stop:1321 length:129 start_codon:yes stop_codon:yes gene_type:complete
VKKLLRNHWVNGSEEEVKMHVIKQSLSVPLKIEMHKKTGLLN